jgi:hypothetical protein
MTSSPKSENVKVDDGFYDRADSFIHLANKHCADIGRGKVSASFMYGMARFNAWVSATGFESAQDMKASRQETLDYFVAQYKAMLEENLDDYIDHFAKYISNTRT